MPVERFTTYLSLLRIPQWIKNGFVAAPAFFGQVMHKSDSWNTVAGIITFCLLSSAGYIVNDISDRSYDQKHPVKKNRPVASGSITLKNAWLIVLLLLLISGSVLLFLPLHFAYWSGGYLLLSLSYTFVLKRIAYLDLLVIAAGFVLRVMAGGALSDIPVSGWLIGMTAAVSLLIASGKRYQENEWSKKNQIDTRRSTRYFDRKILRVFLLISSASCMAGYLSYCMDQNVIARLDTPYLILTAPFVWAGIFRFYRITLQHTLSEEPEKLLWKDPWLGLCFAGWLISFGLLLY